MHFFTAALLGFLSAHYVQAFSTGRSRAQARSSASSLKMAIFEKNNVKFDRNNIPGQLAPMGFFDPLGLSTNIDDQEFKRWREAELKHGRVAMLAALGMLLQESWHPLFGGKVLGAAAWHFQQTQSLYPFWWIPLLAGISITEFVTIRKGWEQPEDVKGTGRPASMSPDYVPGDLNFDPLKLSPPVGSDKFIDYRNKELQNGRLAMLAIAGMVAQELVDGRGILQHIYEVGLFKRG